MRHLARIGFSIALLLLLACSSPDADQGWEVVASRVETWESDPRTPSETWLIRSHDHHRVRVERVCGHEHCATLAFLETLEGDFPRRVAKVVEIREFSDHPGAFIRDVVVVKESDRYAFDLVSRDPYGELSGFTLRVWPGEDFSYESEIRAEFNNY